MPVLSLLTGDTLVPTRPPASTRMQDKPALKHKHDNISIQLSLIGDSIMQRGLSDYMSGIQSAGKVIHKIAMPLGQRVISISRLWLHCSCRVKWIEILFMFLFLDWFPYHLLYGAWFGMCFFFLLLLCLHLACTRCQVTDCFLSSIYSRTASQVNDPVNSVPRNLKALWLLVREK